MNSNNIKYIYLLEIKYLNIAYFFDFMFCKLIFCLEINKDFF